jgi:signal transduction histidine kinase
MLDDSVTTMVNRTRAAFTSQKQFIENASHELQTPLAISINKLELLAEKGTTTEAQAEEISSVILALERATKLNKTLLLLSRIENRQFSDRSSVDINQLTRETISELSDLSEFKSVTVSLVDDSSLTCDMNPELASIMLSNLIKNSIIHNYEGGTVEVKISSSRILVENTGTATTLDESQIFKRFYKNTSLNTSTGLGLSIVKSIADLYGFKLSYQFNGGHVFTIDVPGGA